MIGIIPGLIVGNITEWVAHKYILHGWGKNPESNWNHHWNHHKIVRKHGMYDPEYEYFSFKHPTGHNHEVKSLLLAGLAVTPLFPIAPFFTMTLWYCAGNYYYCHRRCHLNPSWGKKKLPWHIDHHVIGGNHNWCVTKPWTDWVMGTRKKYI